MHKAIAIIILLALTSISVGCNVGICLWNMGYSQLKVKPEKSELIGIYLLNEVSNGNLTKQGYNVSHTKLKIENDGTYILTDVPASILNQSDKTSSTIIKAGRWFVDCKESYGCMIELEGVCVVPLSAKKGRLAVPITIGDPDQCEGIILEKVK